MQLISVALEDSTYFPRFVRTTVDALCQNLNFTQKSVLPRNFFFNKTKFLNNDDITVLWSLGSHTASDLNCIDYMNMKSFFYRKLIPTPQIAAVVNGILMENFSKSTTVGIHIRVQDSANDWNVVTPTNPYGKRAVGFSDASPVAAFETIIRNILKVHPSFRFFVASNSLRVKQHLGALFGTDKVRLHQSITSYT